MLGFRYLKATPTTHVLHYRGGKLVIDGAGLSFWYFAPTTVIALVPVSSRDVPFVFNEVTADFQDVTIQGELTCRIRDVKRVAALLDYTVDVHGRYRSDDPSKLNDRLIHAAQILTRSFTQKRPLKEVLVSSDALVAEVLEGLKSSDGVSMLGVEVLGLSIIGVKAAPEMSKALQTDAREELLRRADKIECLSCQVAVDAVPQVTEVYDLAKAAAGGEEELLKTHPEILAAKAEFGSNPTLFHQTARTSATDKETEAVLAETLSSSKTQ
jgi:hypothetical protein